MVFVIIKTLKRLYSILFLFAKIFLFLFIFSYASAQEENYSSLLKVRVRMMKPDVISFVNLDDYLAGVISREMPLSWPMEALKAQAVVARSYVLTKMLERKNKMFDVESDQMDQVYQKTQSQKAYQAVRETKNIILLNSDQKIVKAFYHSDCGGQTVAAPLVWDSEQDTGTAVDPWCLERQNHRWTFSISKNHFLNLVSDFDQVKYFNGKIVEIAGESIQKLRMKFGFDKIRNSATHLEIKSHQVILSGQGYGHGVGLCQYGARALSQMGKSYSEILNHYYPKTILGKLNSLNSKKQNYLTYSAYADNIL